MEARSVAIRGFIAAAVIGTSLWFVFGGGDQASAGRIEDLRGEIASKDAAIHDLEQRARETKAQLAEIRSRERTLANEVAALDRQIESLELEVRISEGRIEAATLRIQELELEIQRHEEAIVVGEERIGELLRTMQLSEDGIGPVGLVFAARPFSEIFDTLRSTELLDAALAETVGGLKAAKSSLEEAQAKSEAERADAEKLRDELRIRRALLGNQQDERQELLDETQEKEADYQKLLTDILEKQRAVQREIVTLEAELRRAIDPSSLPGKGILSWPTVSQRITQGYGPTSTTGFVNDAYEFHNGVDIGAVTPGTIGDPVFAAAPGIVAGVGSTGKYAYGKWIAVDHRNGIITLYAHLSLQGVSAGQRIERGQILGRMGSTGFSTGPHLHFTVYASETFTVEDRWYGLLPIGGSLNPFNFLE